MANDFVIPEHEKPHNLERKLVVLDSCLRSLEEFQKRFAPNFDSDPMLAAHAAWLRVDIAEIHRRFEAMKQSRRVYRWHAETAPYGGACVQCGMRIPAGSPLAILEAYGKEYWFCLTCAERP